VGLPNKTPSVYLCICSRFSEPLVSYHWQASIQCSMVGSGCCSDDPKEMPSFVASNEATDGCSLKPHGDNIFAALWCVASAFYNL